jgi:hypothetical protein
MISSQSNLPYSPRKLNFGCHLDGVLPSFASFKKMPWPPRIFFTVLIFHNYTVKYLMRQS